MFTYHFYGSKTISHSTIVYHNVAWTCVFTKGSTANIFGYAIVCR